MEFFGGFTVAVAMFGAAFLLGRPLLARLDRIDALAPIEQFVVAVLLGVLPIAASIAVVGSLRYDITTMSVLLVVSLLVGVVINLQSPLEIRLPSWPSGRLEQCLIAVFAVIAFVGLIGGIAPPADHDTLRYHLTLPKRDLELARITVQYGWSVYEFFPPLPGLLNRMAFAIAGAPAVKFVNLCWVFTAAGAAGGLALRLGGARQFAFIAAILFIAQRISIHLAGTGSADFTVAAYFAILVSLVLHWRLRSDFRFTILVGLVAGGMLNTKHHAFVALAALLPFLIWDVIRHRIDAGNLIRAGGVAALLIAPWLIRNAIITGNPLFPAFHDLFDSNNIDIYENLLAAGRRGEGLGFFVTIPWLIFVDQNRFDGFQFGFPFLLLFLPFAFLSYRSDRFLCLGVAFVFLFIWFAVMSHLIRFLMPLIPLLCALAALGLQSLAVIAKQQTVLRVILGTVLVVGIVVQSAFLGATAVRRLRPVLSLQTTKEYLESRPYVWYSQYSACRFVDKRLKPGERYLALLNVSSYYCPQANAFSHIFPGDETLLYKKQPLPRISPTRLAASLESARVRYVIVAKNLGADIEPLVFAKHRYDDIVVPILRKIEPIAETQVAFIYSGEAIIGALKIAGDIGATQEKRNILSK